jgi:hypothetical protein
MKEERKTRKVNCGMGKMREWRDRGVSAGDLGLGGGLHLKQRNARHWSVAGNPYEWMAFSCGSGVAIKGIGSLQVPFERVHQQRGTRNTAENQAISEVSFVTANMGMVSSVYLNRNSARSRGVKQPIRAHPLSTGHGCPPVSPGRLRP